MVVFGLVAAVFLHSVTAQTAHVVGGSIGWMIPQNGPQEYVTWASGQEFIVGDTLSKFPIYIFLISIPYIITIIFFNLLFVYLTGLNPLHNQIGLCM